MKRALLLIIVIYLTICSDLLKAQSQPAKLDQFALWRQTLGTWEYKISKDSTYTYCVEPYGIGGEGWAHITVNGKVIMEGKILMGYDKELDKIIIAYLVKGKELVFTVRWYTSENKYVRVNYKYLSNPEMAPLRYEVEMKGPDMFIEHIFRNNKLTESKTWTRVKK